MNALDISFRDLRESDAAPAAALLDELGYAADEATLRRRIISLRVSPSAEAFVAVTTAQEIVALASLHRLMLLTEDAPLGFITSLVVSRRLRGRGVGRLVVRELCERARQHGCRRLTLTTHLRRADAHAFYERLGFEFTGRRYVLTL